MSDAEDRKKKKKANKAGSSSSSTSSSSSSSSDSEDVFAIDTNKGKGAPPRKDDDDEEEEGYIEAPIEFGKDEAKKTIGSVLRLGRFGIIFFAVALLFPFFFVFITLGVIPLGDPNVYLFDDEGSWPFALAINPTIFTVIGYLIVVAFFGCIEEKHPFRAFLPIITCVYCMEIIIMVPLALSVGFFDFFGGVSLFICYITVFTGLIIHERSKRYRTSDDMKKVFQYFKVLLAIFIHFVLLCVYVIAYRFLPSYVQPFLTAALTLMTFVFRKILLSLTDVFPLEMAMLISSFWIENIADFFYTLAYPSIRDPAIYAFIWVINFFGNAANLLFLTECWFSFRVWIKAVLSCKCGKMPSRNDLDIYDERGHSNNRPGYMRRQVRFYFWKIFSQQLAIIFYLGISALLRFGPNRRYYPLSDDPLIRTDDYTHSSLSDGDYANSLIYVGCNFVALSLAGVFGFLLVRFVYTSTFEAIWKIQGRLMLRNRTYIGYVLAILAHNGLLAVTIIQYHSKIWWSFD